MQILSLGSTKNTLIQGMHTGARGSRLLEDLLLILCKTLLFLLTLLLLENHTGSNNFCTLQEKQQTATSKQQEKKPSSTHYYTKVTSRQSRKDDYHFKPLPPYVMSPQRLSNSSSDVRGVMLPPEPKLTLHQ